MEGRELVSMLPASLPATHHATPTVGDDVAGSLGRHLGRPFLQLPGVHHAVEQLHHLLWLDAGHVQVGVPAHSTTIYLLIDGLYLAQSTAQGHLRAFHYIKPYTLLLLLYIIYCSCTTCFGLTQDRFRLGYLHTAPPFLYLLTGSPQG